MLLYEPSSIDFTVCVIHDHGLAARTLQEGAAFKGDDWQGGRGTRRGPPCSTVAQWPLRSRGGERKTWHAAGPGLRGAFQVRVVPR